MPITFPARPDDTTLSVDVIGTPEAVRFTVERGSDTSACQRLSATLTRAAAVDLARRVLLTFREPGLTPAHRPGEIWRNDFGNVIQIASEHEAYRYDPARKRWVPYFSLHKHGTDLHERLAGSLEEAVAQGALPQEALTGPPIMAELLPTFTAGEVWLNTFGHAVQIISEQEGFRYHPDRGHWTPYATLNAHGHHLDVRLAETLGEAVAHGSLPARGSLPATSSRAAPGEHVS